MKFLCATCGAEHDANSVSFGANAPVQWDLLSPEERERSELGDEDCFIQSAEGMSFYIRGCLDIPVRGGQQTFTWGVWCSLSEASMREMFDHFADPNRENYGPYFGWLCTKLPHYPDTMFLKTTVRQRKPGLRPLVELEVTGHPLALQQREGIESAALQALVHDLLQQT